MADDKPFKNMKGNLFDLKVDETLDHVPGEEWAESAEPKKVVEDPLEDVMVPVDTTVGSIFAEKYQVLEVAGRGGMSAVYKANHLALNKDVAIKVLYPHLAYNAKSILRFQQEAQVVSHLDHPGIVRLFDFGQTAEGQPYLIMEFLKGMPLSSVLDDKPNGLDIEVCLKYFVAMCEALSHAHKNGVVHRDLKPSNIFVEPNDEGEQIKITDFGIAKLNANEEKGELKLTATGEIFGSPLYMSPEQCKGTKVDHRSDIYSLGCLMYEALTGRAPHEGETVYETMQKHMTEEAELPSKLRSEIRNFGDLEIIILKSIAKKPQDRYQSANDLLNALKNVTATSKFNPVNALTRMFGLARVRSKSKLVFALFCISATIVSIVLIMVASMMLTFGSATISNVPKIETRAAEGTWRRASEEAQRLINKGDYEAAKPKLKEAETLAISSGRPEDLLLTLKKEAMVAQIVRDSSLLKQISSQIESTKTTVAEKNKLSEELSLLLEAFDSFPDQLSDTQKTRFESLTRKILAWSRNAVRAEKFADAEKILEQVKVKLSKIKDAEPRLVIETNLAYDECVVFQYRNQRFSTRAKTDNKKLEAAYINLRELVSEPSKSQISAEDLKWADALVANLASVYKSEKRFEYFAGKSLAYFETAPGSASKRAPQAYALVADGYTDQFKLNEANRLYEKALKIFNQSGDYAGAGHCYHMISLNLLQQGKLSAARNFLIAGLKRATDAPEVDDLMISRLYFDLGNSLWREGQIAGAKDAYLNAATIQQQLLPTESWLRTGILNNVSQAYFNKARFDPNALKEAEPYCRQWLAILELQKPIDVGDVNFVRDMLAVIYMNTGRDKEAKETFDLRFKNLLSQPDDEIVIANEWLPDVALKYLDAAGKDQLAARVDVAVVTAEKKRSKMKLARLLESYARLYWSTDKMDKAVATSRKAAEYCKKNFKDDPYHSERIIRDYITLLSWSGKNTESELENQVLKQLLQGR